MNFFVAAAVAILGFLAPSAAGNTEVVNFGRNDLQELPRDMTVSNAWPTLKENTRHSYRVNISWPCEVLCDLDGTVCSQDVWLGLDPRQSHRYTLRISWPATMPSRFDVDLYQSTAHQTSPSEVTSYPIYARIRVASTGIKPPTDCEVDLTTLIRFDVILEPLVGGIIPRSLLPTLAFLTIAVPLFCMVGDRVHAYLSELAKHERARNLAGGSSQKKAR